MLMLSRLYFSRYSLTVAPDEPVPLSLKTNLEPSAYVKMYPWLGVTSPVTGSVYVKLVAVYPSV